jgi:hypothetical protein
MDEPEDTRTETFVDTYVPTQPSLGGGAGVFPTYAEKMLLDGGQGDYPRSRSGFGGPDRSYQASSGLIPYDSLYGGIYPSHPDVFDPVNRTLGFFSSHQALAWEGDGFQNASATLDGSLFPLFIRNYEPDRSQVRFGPFSGDLLYLGAGALYSDFQGAQRFPDGREDGFISYIDLGARAVAQITDQFYLALGLNLIYLPGTNQLGFSINNGNLTPGLAFALERQGSYRGWDYRVFDRFSGAFGALGVFEDLSSDAFNAAGRYSFGINGRFDDRGTDSLFDNESILFANRIGASASALTSPVWRSSLNVDHTDFWRTFDFEDGGSRDHFGALLGYEGAGLPLSPSFSYDVFSNDSFESFNHRVAATLRGRVAENLALSASTGYFWTTDLNPDRQSWLWNLNLTHDLSERTVQTFGVGQDLVTNDFTPDQAWATYARYRLSHRVSTRLYGSILLQHSEAERLNDTGGSRTADLAGVKLSYRPLDYTEVFAQTAWEETQWEGDAPQDRSIYQVGLNQRILSRLYGGLLAQYEDTDFFDERLYWLTIRRYF